jgi:hypothetical protein
MKIRIKKIAFSFLIITILMVSLIATVSLAQDSNNRYEKRVYNGPKIVYEENEYMNPDFIENKKDESGLPVGESSVIDKRAVVIGIADYPGWINDLSYPDDDALDMYNYLLAQGYPVKNIKLLIDGQANAKNIMRAINWMNRQEQNVTSECVFFYSGHGDWYEGYNDFDSEYRDEGIVAADYKLILDGQLRQKFTTFTSKKITFIFDCCFSGGMNDLIGAHVPRNFFGRTVSTACGESELSYDGQSDLQNGVFTYYFIEGLYLHDTIEDAFIYARPRARRYIWVNYREIMIPLLYDTYPGKWMF